MAATGKSAYLPFHSRICIGAVTSKFLWDSISMQAPTFAEAYSYIWSKICMFNDSKKIVYVYYSNLRTEHIYETNAN